MNINQFSKISIVAVFTFSLIFGAWFYIGVPQFRLLSEFGVNKIKIPFEIKLARAQSGLSVTNDLVLHLDADAITGLSDNDSVTQWDDLSGEGNHATQTTEANRPTYKTGVLDGKPVVRFDGSNDHLLVSSFSHLNEKSGATIIFMYKHADTHSGQYLIWADGNILIDAVNDFGNPTGWNNFRVRWNLGGTWRNDHIAAISTQEWQQVVITFDGGETKFYTDGNIVYTGSDTQTSISASSPNYMLGGRAAGRYFDGDIAEILIYDRALSGSEREQVEQYLGEKWLGWEPLEKGFEMGSLDYRIWKSSINVGGLDYQESERYRLRETIGEVVAGDTASPSYKLRSGYQPMIESYIAAAALPEDITMSPSIGGITGGQSNGTTSIKVTTDSPSGYSLFVRASASPALATSTYSFADYIPNNPEIPDYNWSVPATTTGFGFTPYGPDTAPKYRHIGENCNEDGGSESKDHCWYNLSISDETIAASYLSNHPEGTETYIRFRAESGTQNIQSAGEYSATLIITVIPN